jgi:alpha-N-arabinofuranosidase
MVWLGICQAQNPTATVTIDANSTLKTVDKHVYGSNVEWFHDGNFIWNAAAGANNTLLTARAKALGVSLLRFPGGTLADYYHWRNGIGPIASRPISPHGMDAGSSANNFGLHEFMNFCRSTGADPMLQVNVVTGTASEAADWVNYSNASQNTERAANGSAAPFGISSWEVGNEQYLPNWPGTLSQSILTADEYVSRLIAYTNAMKAADPTIKVGAVGGKNFGRYALMADDNWNATLLQKAAPYIDFLSVHNAYGPMVLQPDAQSFWDVYGAMLAFPKLVGDNLATINRQIVQYAPAYANKIKIGVTEWGPLFDVSPSNPYVGHAKTLGSGVFTASMVKTFLLADRVTLANLFQLTSPLFLGSINWDGVVKPSYFAMQMYANYFGTTLVSTLVDSPTYNSVAVGTVDAVQGVPYLEAISSVSADRKKVYVMVINKNWSSGITTTIQLKNFAARSSGTAHVMTAPSIDANNGNDLPAIPGVVWAQQRTAPVNSMFNLGAPGTVAIVDSSFAVSSTIRYTAQAMSVSVLEFTAR